MEENKTFQDRVTPWIKECFGIEVASDHAERSHRFLEEALELVQVAGCTKSEVLQLVDYVFDRPKGEVKQEVGGVMVTLASLCSAHGINMHECGEEELKLVWEKIEKIRAKWKTKPEHSPLLMPIEKFICYKEVDKQTPEIGEWVVVLRGNGEYTEWISKGRRIQTGTWVIKEANGLNYENSTPTHWIEFPNKR